ncbi:MAG TPA: hypothetical protein VFC42_15115 [Methylomirabilota bacterium]|nr:hypothetical protein [Methylomirabilota bacterium]
MAARAAALPSLGSHPLGAESAPCADLGLLTPLKQSPEYRRVRPRIADVGPADAWQDGGLHYFVFALTPEPSPGGPAVALFVMEPSEPVPVAALVITPGADPTRPRVVDARNPERPLTVRL